MDLDLVIRGAQVVDGTGAPRRRASVGIANGRIEAVDSSDKLTARETLDGSGLVLAPGFIDTHSHSDLRLLAEPDLRMKVLQGVTLEVLGQDGISVAPVKRENQGLEKKKLTGLLGTSKLMWSWTSIGEFLDELDRAQLSPNVAMLVPHGTLRSFVMGSEDRDPTADELAGMVKVLDESMTAGAIGISTGLIYPPCCYAKTPELIALGRVAAKHGGPFVVHLRSESDRILEAIDEMVSVGRESGCRVHISHFKIAGKENFQGWLQVKEKVEAARRSGVIVTCDQYPYAAGSTMLGAILPPWAHSGGSEATLERLRNDGERAKMKAQMADPALVEWDNFWRWTGGDGIVVSDVPSGKRPELVGKTIAWGAQQAKKDPLDFALDLLRDENMGVGMISHNQSEDVVERLMLLPYVNICTDGLLGGRPHPRAYGTYPRLLGRYVRERKALPLEEAIRKMTGQAALAMNLSGVGLVQKGCRADLVLFDEAKILDHATYAEPMLEPEGMVHVLVNGKHVLRDSKPLGRVGGGKTVRGRKA